MRFRHSAKLPLLTLSLLHTARAIPTYGETPGARDANSDYDFMKEVERKCIAAHPRDHQMSKRQEPGAVCDQDDFLDWFKQQEKAPSFCSRFLNIPAATRVDTVYPTTNVYSSSTAYLGGTHVETVTVTATKTAALRENQMAKRAEVTAAPQIFQQRKDMSAITSSVNQDQALASSVSSGCSCIPKPAETVSTTVTATDKYRTHVVPQVHYDEAADTTTETVTVTVTAGAESSWSSTYTIPPTTTTWSSSWESGSTATALPIADCPAANGSTSTVVEGGNKYEYTIICNTDVVDSGQVALYRTSSMECEASCSIANNATAGSCTGFSYGSQPDASGNNCFLKTNHTYSASYSATYFTAWLTSVSSVGGSSGGNGSSTGGAAGGTAGGTAGGAAGGEDSGAALSSASANSSPAITTPATPSSTEEGRNGTDVSSAFSSSVSDTSWTTHYTVSTSTYTSSSSSYTVISSNSSSSSSSSTGEAGGSAGGSANGTAGGSSGGSLPLSPPGTQPRNGTSWGGSSTGGNGTYGGGGSSGPGTPTNGTIGGGSGSSGNGTYGGSGGPGTSPISGLPRTGSQTPPVSPTPLSSNSTTTPTYPITPPGYPISPPALNTSTPYYPTAPPFTISPPGSGNRTGSGTPPGTAPTIPPYTYPGGNSSTPTYQTGTAITPLPVNTTSPTFGGGNRTGPPYYPTSPPFSVPGNSTASPYPTGTGALPTSSVPGRNGTQPTPSPYYPLPPGNSTIPGPTGTGTAPGYPPLFTGPGRSGYCPCAPPPKTETVTPSVVTITKTETVPCSSCASCVTTMPPTPMPTGTGLEPWNYVPEPTGGSMSEADRAMEEGWRQA